eukprot:GHVS01056971.1.p1 GENE.GHVS01056971.1~~GHVS01056971.1.p1  ORF type:complete len:118 (-),score=15.57 GHVS01056971.1:660-1013(-)
MSSAAAVVVTLLLLVGISSSTPAIAAPLASSLSTLGHHRVVKVFGDRLAEDDIRELAHIANALDRVATRFLPRGRHCSNTVSFVASSVAMDAPLCAHVIKCLALCTCATTSVLFVSQ